MTTFAGFDDIEQFRAYVAAKPAGAYVGTAYSPISCPLARYATEIGIGHVHVSDLLWYDERADPLTEWQEQFISLIDATHYGVSKRVTREECLVAIDAVRSEQ